MKAVMSEKMREVLKNPESRKQLQTVLSNINNLSSSAQNYQIINVGNEKYRVKILRRDK